ncbi:MAG TPA: DUF3857 and transglutaminase domain-containing protein [Terracidiphilus sp.]
MTSDPKAPGAAAVYLNVEEIDNNPGHSITVSARIKVLTEKGKELATVEIPYWHNNYKIFNIQARTIHSDGTVIPLTGKPDDLLSFKETTQDGYQDQVNRKVFNLPSVEVGSILEYHYQIEIGDYLAMEPRWEIQQKYFVHKAHYAFTSIDSQVHNSSGESANTLVWWPVLPAGASVKKFLDGRYTLDVSDIPPMPDEEWMPPVQNFRYKVLFYYIHNPNVDLYWEDQIKRWSSDVDHFAEATKALRDAVNGLITPADSDLDKAKKLYNAVQALDNTDYSRKKSEAELRQLKLKEIKRAEDVWTQKSGDSEEIALLYLAMLRAAGLTANAMKVVDRERGIFDITYLSTNQLDSTIVMLSLGGKTIALDPGVKMCPFQTLSWRHSNASGFLEGSDGKAGKTSPPQIYSENKQTRLGDLTLDSQGNVEGTVQFAMTGQEALHWRQMALTNDEQEVRKNFDQWLETLTPNGVEAHIDRFHALDQPDQKLLADISVKGSLGAATARRLIVPGFFFETRGGHPFVEQEKRLEPVDMRYGEIVSEQITYHLPEGFTVEGAPPDTKNAWPGHAVFVTKTESTPGQVVIGRSLARAFTFATQQEYQDLRGFYQKIAASDQGQLVLTTAPAAPKGN